MAPRIQFRATDEEYEAIEQNALIAGFSSVSQFVKEIALAYPDTIKNSKVSKLSFAEIYQEVTSAVAKKVAEVLANNDINPRFVLREITPSWRWHNNPQHENMADGTVPKPLRASVGKHFYNEVKKGKAFPNVRYTGKVDRYGTAIYEVFIKEDEVEVAT
ncbi:MAG: hypothetical protein LBI44_01040 [Oscillospiraceae bacterium]|jgi:uncharacterized protein (DUF1778 family)|nr:hypothetical protein [Oscillospiraceae bacterium]